MRIIAGRFRSRRLKTLRGAALRPTSDRLRETLFNVLGARVAGAVFVDLYAGTGAVGLEALSRGAARVVFVEKHPAAAALLRANLSALGIAVETGGEAEILAMDALRGLARLEQGGARADIVFLDPPYDAAQEYARALTALGAGTLLAPGAVVVAESRRARAAGRRAVLPETAGALRAARTLEQGGAVLTFYVQG